MASGLVVRKPATSGGETHYFATELENRKQVEVTLQDGDANNDDAKSVESMAKSSDYSTPAGSTPASTPASTPRKDAAAESAEAAAEPTTPTTPPTTSPKAPTPPLPKEMKTPTPTPPPASAASPAAAQAEPASPTLDTKLRDIDKSNALLEKQLQALQKVLDGYAAKRAPRRPVNHSYEDRLRALEKQNARYRKENEALSKQIAEQEAWLNQSVQLTPMSRAVGDGESPAGAPLTPMTNGESLSREAEAKDILLKQLRHECTRLQTQIKLQVKSLDREKKLEEMLEKLKVGASAEEEMLHKQVRAVVDERTRIEILGEAAEREHGSLLKTHFPSGETGVTLKELKVIECTDALIKSREKDIAGLRKKQELMKKSLANEKLKTNRSLTDQELLIHDLQVALQGLARTLDSKRALLDRNRGVPHPPSSTPQRSSLPRKPARLDPVDEGRGRAKTHPRRSGSNHSNSSAAAGGRAAKPAAKKKKTTGKAADGGFATCFESASEAASSRRSSPASSRSSSVSSAASSVSTPLSTAPTTARTEKEKTPRETTAINDTNAAAAAADDDDDECETARMRFLYPEGSTVRVNATGETGTVTGVARGRVGVSVSGGGGAAKIVGLVPSEITKVADGEDEDECETARLKFLYPAGTSVRITQPGGRRGVVGSVVGTARGRVGVEIDGAVVGYIPCHIEAVAGGEDDEEDACEAARLKFLFPVGARVRIAGSGAEGTVVGTARGRVGVEALGTVMGFVPPHLERLGAGEDDEEDECESARIRFLFPDGARVKITTSGAEGTVVGTARGRVGVQCGTAVTGVLPAHLEALPADDEDDPAETAALRKQFPPGASVEITTTGAKGTVVGVARGRVGVETPAGVVGVIACHVRSVGAGGGGGDDDDDAASDYSEDYSEDAAAATAPPRASPRDANETGVDVVELRE